jgi:spermidine dehydrogenase
LEEKVEFLRNTSYEDFLLKVAQIGREAISFLETSGGWTIGLDGVPAWLGAGRWPGTTGLGLGDDVDGAKDTAEERAFFQFPDGNASIARLIVRSLIPEVAPGSTMEDIVDAPFDYGKLDREGSAVRVRLESTAVRVAHRGDRRTAKEVEVTYVRDGHARRVRAGRCVLACYNAVIPLICDELPDPQKQALSNALKSPLVYTNVLIRNWTAFAKLGVSRVRCPGGYFENVNVPPPISIGNYRHAGTPEEPIVVRMWRVPLAPEARGRSVAEQWKAARHGLLTTTFATFERKIRDQLGRILSAGGFDPARDIAAITVNRWPHGYAKGLDPKTGQIAWRPDEVPPERAPWVAARHAHGRIAIANSDAGARAMTEIAIGQAHRAVSELLSA